MVPMILQIYIEHYFNSQVSPSYFIYASCDQYLGIYIYIYMHFIEVSVNTLVEKVPFPTQLFLLYIT